MANNKDFAKLRSLISDKLSNEQSPYAYKQYAKVIADITSSLSGGSTTLSSIERNRVSSLINNIDSNANDVGNMLSTLYKTNGSVLSIINYFSSLLTYNHNIYPSPDLKATDGHKMENITISDYLVASQQLENYQLKFYMPYFIRETLIRGTTFFYEVSTSSGVAYIEFPASMCKISYIEDGVYRFMIDISKIRENMLPYLPKEIQTAYTNGVPTEENKNWNGNYYMVGKKGVAFTFDPSALKNGGIGVSPFSSLLLDAIDVKKSKENVDVKDNIDALRLIHGKIPTDASSGTLLMPPEEAAEWQKVINSGLPNGAVAIVSPFQLDNISLVNSGNAGAYDTVSDAQKQMFKSASVPQGMFGGETTSSNIVKLSIIKDAAWIFNTAVPLFTNYYNSVLSNVKTESNAKWKIKILNQDFFNKKEQSTLLKDAITLGGSRTDYLASIDMEPLEIYTKLYTEQHVLDIDSLMAPKPTSYTMSGSNQSDSKSKGSKSAKLQPSGEVGRPATDNPTDDTDRINDSN